MSQGGIYFHFPFCRSKCGYCDFFSVPHEENFAERIINKYIEELVYWQQWSGLDLFQSTTLYLGGGSPSLITLKQLERLLKQVQKHWTGCSEFTFEINPEHCDQSYLQGLRQLGVTKLSIGVQTFNDHLLSVIGRSGSKEKSLQVVEWAQQIGFPVLSLDLMFALPEQSLQHLEDDLDFFLNLGLEHLSIYQLTVPDHHPMNSFFPDLDRQEQKQRDMFIYISDVMQANGFHHYEISNFANAPKNYSQHNLHYWQGRDYLGLGPGAHSRLQNLRFFHKPDVHSYLNNHFMSHQQSKTKYITQHHYKNILHTLKSIASISEVEYADKKIRIAEYFIGQLRLKEGICFPEIPLPEILGASGAIKKDESKKIMDKLKNEWQLLTRKAQDLNWLVQKGERFHVTQLGMLFYDSLLQDFTGLIEIIDI